jgi:sulfide:quinone oxidoreductase
VLPPVHKGDLAIDTGGEVGQFTSGSFSMVFEDTGGDIGFGRTLATRFPDVYALGDVATVGTPKAGVFSERQARVVARTLIERVRGGRSAERYDGRGSCYIEFGGGLVARIDVDFFSEEKPTGTFQDPSTEFVAEKVDFGSTRRARWFGL